ncbi:MAG: hypothetical protein AB8V75_03520 [Coxiella endosymbiont of Dermacentor nuttalli]
MNERKKLSLNRPRKASHEENPKSNPIYRKKVWVNATPKKQSKKAKPQQAVKVKIPKLANGKL